MKPGETFKKSFARGSKDQKNVYREDPYRRLPKKLEHRGTSTDTIIITDMKDLFNLLSNIGHAKDFDRIYIGLASPEKIRSWSYGEVKTAETINYRSFKPENEGLFCAKIFGPTKDYECLCGKYKLFKHQGIVCERCGVEVTKNSVRRERMGHIELAVPVAHIWYFKSLPSRIGLLLDMSVRDLERVIYFETHVVTDPASTSLKMGQLLSEGAYLEALEAYGDEFEARMGSEAIYELLRTLDLEREHEQLREQIHNSHSENTRKRLTKRLKLVQSLLNSDQKPEWMILTALPVLPPDLRPLVPLDGGSRFASSDLNDLYRRVINRNNRTKRLLNLKAPDVVIRNEKRLLQESVDALFDNGRRGRVFTGINKLQLQSLANMIKGKQGRFRQNLLGKRVDYSGRSVIVAEPSLKLHQCGLPKEMALELFKPFLFHKLQEDQLATSISAAKKCVEQKTDPIWKALKEVVRQHPVLLNRVPTLYRLGIQAFEPVLIEGKAIQLHPLICKAFDAHFDGDQMAVHIPLSIEAQMEAWDLMMSDHHIYSPVNGKPLIMPSQEMVLGLYLMTRDPPQESSGEGRVFANVQEVERAYDSNVVELSERCEVRLQIEEEQEERVQTTVGRAILSQCLPKEVSFEFINRSLTSPIISELIHYCYRLMGTKKTLSWVENLSSLGLTYATHAGITLAIKDMVVPPQKSRLIKEARLAVDKIQQQYIKGLITNGQRYNQIIDIWTKTNEQMTQAVNDEFKGVTGKTLSSNRRTKKVQKNSLPENILYLMVEAGVQSLTPIFQLSGMRGLMKKSDGSILERPITRNFRDGLNVHQYFISSHGARKGQTDTVIRTANAGYLTRRLVDVAQDIIIAESDCGTSDGLTFTAFTQDGQVIESLSDRILGRVVAEDIFIPERQTPIVTAGTMLDEHWVNFLERMEVNQIKVRSPITCQSKHGVCAKCYGYDLANGQLITIGEAIGVMAAQSIGECANQLACCARRAGGVAKLQSSVNHLEVKYNGVIQLDNLKLIRLKAKKDGKTMTKSFASNPHFINVSHSGEIIVLDSSGIKRQCHKIPYGAIVSVKDGDKVKEDQRIAYWDPHSYPIITEVTGYVHFMDVIEGVTVNREIDENNGQVTYQVKAPKQWPTHAKDWLPRVKLVDKSNRDIKSTGSKQPVIYVLPPYAIITLEEGAKVNAGDIIAHIDIGRKNREMANGLLRVIDLFEARIPKEPAILARCSGTITLGKNTKTQHRFIITDEDGQTEQFSIPKWRQPSLSAGQPVEIGEELVEGEMNLHDILHLKGINDLVEYLIKEIQQIYTHHGIKINDKHVEVIIRQMLRTIAIVEPGDTRFLSGEYVTYSKLQEENQTVIENSGQPATWEPNLLGITKSSLATESFISAASFVDTTRVLLASAVKGKIDELRGLKENLIIGRLIPAGTGRSYHKDRQQH